MMIHIAGLSVGHSTEMHVFLLLLANETNYCDSSSSELLTGRRGH